MPTGSKAPKAYVLPHDLGGKHWLDSDETQEVRVSIGHDGGFATATCIAFEFHGQRKIISERGNLRGPFVGRSVFKNDDNEADGLRNFFKDLGENEDSPKTNIHEDLVGEEESFSQELERFEEEDHLRRIDLNHLNEVDP